MDNAKGKDTVISFKADQGLAKALDGLPNRSSFIRDAVRAALESTCPLCRGTGILTAEQRRHWQAFSQDHEVRQCATCQAVHLVCRHEADGQGHGH